MTVELPQRLREKADTLPESSYGVTTVTLVLADGRRIGPVAIGWATDIIRVEGRPVESAADLSFDPEDIVDLVDHLGREPPRRWFGWGRGWE